MADSGAANCLLEGWLEGEVGGHCKLRRHHLKQASGFLPEMRRLTNHLWKDTDQANKAKQSLL